MIAETITPEVESTRELEHYRNIREQAQLVHQLNEDYERSKLQTAHKKKTSDLAKLELVAMIRQGPDYQMTLPFGDIGDWRGIALEEDEGMPKTEQLKEAGIYTVGDLSDFTGAGHELSEVAGIGPESAERIADALTEFWAAHPEVAHKHVEDNDGNDNQGNG